jgi:exonuclease VII large subunit
LERGYSLTTRDDTGAILRDSADVQPGDLLRTLLAAGEIVSRVV